eukprot:6746642-Ditylum_brightwellii.AAC.2
MNNDNKPTLNAPNMSNNENQPTANDSNINNNAPCSNISTSSASDESIHHLPPKFAVGSRVWYGYSESTVLFSNISSVAIGGYFYSIKMEDDQ